jgi:hypothetical protein
MADFFEILMMVLVGGCNLAHFKPGKESYRLIFRFRSANRSIKTSTIQAFRFKF